MDKWEKFWKKEEIPQSALPNEFFIKNYKKEKNKKRIRKEGDILVIDEDWYIPSQHNNKALLVYDKGHHEILDFPLCPITEEQKPLIVYANNLVIGKNLIVGYSVPFIIISFAFNDDKTELWVRCKQDLKYNACEHIRITYKDNYYIHYIDTFYPFYDIDDGGNQIFYWPWERK